MDAIQEILVELGVESVDRMELNEGYSVDVPGYDDQNWIPIEYTQHPRSYQRDENGLDPDGFVEAVQK